MNTTSNPAPVDPGLTASAVARATGLSRTALYQLHQWGEGMGAPGHFHYPDHGELTYTLRGLCALVEALSASGHTVASAALGELVKRLRAGGAVPPSAAGSLKEMHRWDLEAERRLEEFNEGQAA